MTFLPGPRSGAIPGGGAAFKMPDSRTVRTGQSMVVSSTDPPTLSIAGRTSEGLVRHQTAMLELDENITAENALDVLTLLQADDTTNTFSTADPWFSTVQAEADETTLWRKRTSFGFDALSNTRIYELWGDGVGDAGEASPNIWTDITGLTAGRTYEVYIAHLSVAPAGDTACSAGFSESTMQYFTDVGPINLGVATTAANHYQFLSRVGYATADDSGEIRVYVNAVRGVDRVWYAGLAYREVSIKTHEEIEPVELATFAVWTWFNSSSIINLPSGDTLVGYVDSEGYSAVASYSASGTVSNARLSSQSQVDDHNDPSFALLPSGQVLACYSTHNSTTGWYYRISSGSSPKVIGDWGSEQNDADSVTGTPHSYANVFHLRSEGNTWMFGRQVNYNPTVWKSTDNGATWGTATELIRESVSSTVRPYVRYFSKDRHRIVLAYNQNHPTSANNDVWFVYFNENGLYQADGTLVKAYASLPALYGSGETGDQIYTYSADAWTTETIDDYIPAGRPWINDIVEYSDGTIKAAYSVVTRDSDFYDRKIYFYISTYTPGTGWSRLFVAQGGFPLYQVESDYTGCIALDPGDKSFAYFCSNHQDPASRDVAVVASDTDWLGRNLFEIELNDAGTAVSTIRQLTRDTHINNIRPKVVNTKRGKQIAWIQGGYTDYTSWTSSVRIMDLAR